MQGLDVAALGPAQPCRRPALHIDPPVVRHASTRSLRSPTPPRIPQPRGCVKSAAPRALLTCGPAPAVRGHVVNVLGLSASPREPLCSAHSAARSPGWRVPGVGGSLSRLVGHPFAPDIHQAVRFVAQRVFATKDRRPSAVVIGTDAVQKQVHRAQARDAIDQFRPARRVIAQVLAEGARARRFRKTGWPVGGGVTEAGTGPARSAGSARLMSPGHQRRLWPAGAGLRPRLPVLGPWARSPA